MKKIDIKIIFLFTFIFISVSFVNAQKEIKQIVIQDYRIQEVKRQNERLQQQIDSLRIEVEKTKIGTEYFNTLFDNQNYSYSFIITGFAIILGLIALISWGVFWGRVSMVKKKLEKKFNDAIQKHKQEENEFLNKFDFRQHSLMKFASNLSILLANSSLEKNELGIALYCYLYSIEEYEEKYYKNLSSILRDELRKFEKKRFSFLKARLESIYRICRTVIEKDESLPYFTLQRWEKFKKAQLYLNSNEIQNLRMKIIFEMDNFLENKKKQINENEKE